MKRAVGQVCFVVRGDHGVEVLLESEQPQYARIVITQIVFRVRPGDLALLAKVVLKDVALVQPVQRLDGLFETDGDEQAGTLMVAMWIKKSRQVWAA